MLRDIPKWRAAQSLERIALVKAVITNDDEGMQ